MHRLLRILSTGLVLVAFAPTAGAQTIFNKLEVQRLVDRADADSHAALHRHFIALASKLTADVDRRTLACDAIGNVNRPQTPSLRWHCLSALSTATREAATVRELARYHADRAIGWDAALPAGAGPYEAGKGSPAPTLAQVRAIEREARTRADHRFLEEYFGNIAAVNLATLERQYAARSLQVGRSGRTLTELAIKRARAAADAAIASAERHHQLANLG